MPAAYSFEMGFKRISQYIESFNSHIKWFILSVKFHVKQNVILHIYNRVLRARNSELCVA